MRNHNSIIVHAAGVFNTETPEKVAGNKEDTIYA